jgi:DNA-binding MarR family transcriptional regulator
MPAATETETAQRLRVAVGRLSRLLRPTEAGLAAALTPTRAAVLLNATRNAPVRLAVIAEQEGLNPTLLSRTIANLVADGLLTRTADPDDRRSAFVEPTAEGSKLADRIRKERTDAVEAALSGLSEDDRRALAEALPALERFSQQLDERRR